MMTCLVCAVFFCIDHVVLCDHVTTLVDVDHVPHNVAEQWHYHPQVEDYHVLLWCLLDSMIENASVILTQLFTILVV